MKIVKLSAALLCALFVYGCSGGLKTAVVKGGLAPRFEDTRLEKDYLWVRGIAAANPLHTSKTQRMAMSREAAIANAYQRAAEYVAGLGVMASVRVKDAVSQDSTLETKVNAAVRGAEIFSSEYTGDDGCTVIVRIPRARLRELGIEFPEK
ncbi:MAG: hypothetical protein PHP45_10085 [Elusimicrobiales bacterium]|nr:hypothetical protein [Elusimicrobiales bacterium]